MACRECIESSLLGGSRRVVSLYEDYRPLGLNSSTRADSPRRLCEAFASTPLKMRASRSEGLGRLLPHDSLSDTVASGKLKSSL